MAVWFRISGFPAVIAIERICESFSILVCRMNRFQTDDLSREKDTRRQDF